MVFYCHCLVARNYNNYQLPEAPPPPELDDLEEVPDELKLLPELPLE
jgi:hypothetical protein